MRRIVIILLIICPQLSWGQIITTIAGSGGYGLGTTGGFGGDNGLATNARMNQPAGITIDLFGNIYIAEGNARIRKIDTANIITTFGGNGVSGFSGDHGPATNAEFSSAMAHLYWHDNILYIPDFLNSRIRTINAMGIVNTIAGDSLIGCTGNGGPASAAELCSPTGIKFDKNGNLYLADEYDYIRKIDTIGVITTISGNGLYGFAGDGGKADTATINGPVDIAIDNKRNIFFSDSYNNKIRKIDCNGIISTYAGSDTLGGYTGDNGPATNAKIFVPDGIIVDDIGNVYFSDEGNFVVRKIDTAGIITTIVGNGIEGYYGDNGPATAAELDKPTGLCFDKYGNLYIADWWNNRVRKVSNVGTMVSDVPISKLEDLKIYPNPAKDFLNISSPEIITQISISNIVGQCVYSQYFNDDKVVVDIKDLAKGVYFIKINNEIVRKVIKE